MDITLKPIKALFIISIALHGFAFFLSKVLVLFYQRPFWPPFSGATYSAADLRGAALFSILAPLIILFALHLGIALVFLMMIRSNNHRTQSITTSSILMLIILSVVYPILSFVFNNLRFRFIARSLTIDALTTYIGVMHRLNAGFILRNISITVLIIALAMFWYYCYVARANRHTLPMQ